MMTRRTSVPPRRDESMVPPKSPTSMKGTKVREILKVSRRQDSRPNVDGKSKKIRHNKKERQIALKSFEGIGHTGHIDADKGTDAQ